MLLDSRRIAARGRRMAAIPRKSQLTGVATSAVPPGLKLLWTVEAGDGVDSSAAISGGTVYVAAQSADLVAIDLRAGSCAGNTAARTGSASSPAVREGVVYSATWPACCTPCARRTGKNCGPSRPARDQVFPVIDGDRLLIGSYDGNLYCLTARDGKLLWKLPRRITCMPRRVSWAESRILAGCDEVFHGIRIADGNEVLHFPAAGTPAPRWPWAEGVRTTVRSAKKWWRWTSAPGGWRGVISARARSSRSIRRRR